MGARIPKQAASISPALLKRQEEVLPMAKLEQRRYKDLETLSCMGFEVFLCCGERTKAGDWLLGAAGRGWTTAGAGDDKNCGAIKEIRIFMANRKN